MTLVITDAGLQEIGVEPGESASSGKSKPRAMAKPSHSLADPTSRRSRGSKPARRSPAKAYPRGPRTGSNQDQVIGLLPRPEGASVEEMAKATGCRAIPCRASCPVP